jgi:hypothetical protein
MKKKVLSILLALCLVLTLLPSLSQAVAIYRLYVGNTLVFDYTSSSPESTWETGTTYYWKAAGSGDYAYTQTGNANDYLFSVNFDEGIESFTLTLNGVNITTTDSSGHGIYSNSSLNIVLVDDSSNYVSSSGDAIYVSQNVGISGSGSLTVTAGTSSSGIYSPYSNIIIEGGTVTANGNTGISASQGSITISGGSVTAGGKGNGIWASGNFTVSGGSAKVTATNTYGQSIYTSGSVSVTANPYKYRTNTSATEPDTNYTLYPSTAFANSGSYKYIEIISCPEVYVSGDNTNSDTVLVSSVTDSGNISYWLNDGSGSITNTGASASNYNVKYNEATQSLTLKGATITSYYSDGEHQYGIHTQSDLNIVLEDSSVIGTVGMPVGTTGIQCGGDLSISAASGGNLSIVSDEGGIDADGRVSINGVTVSITSGRTAIKCDSGLTLSNSILTIVSEETGIYARDDVAVTGAQTTLNVTACIGSNNVGYGIFSLGNTLFADATLSITKNGTRGDAVRARNDIRIYGGADISIVDWSTSDGDDCGLHSNNGNVAIGGSAQVDICSQRIGIYAQESVYLGYVWNGSAYAVSGSTTVNFNDSVNVAAITPDTPDDFVIGISGIKASNGGISMSGGTLTAIGSEKALYFEAESLTLPSSYKYKSNTEASAPTGSYTYGTYTYSEDDKYLEIAATYTVTKAAAENGSFTVSVGGAEAESAAVGDTVTLTAVPSSGYALSSWNVYQTGDTATTVSVSGNSFTMPAYPVTAAALFAPLPSSSGSDDPQPSRTITVTETSSELFRGAQGAVRAEANMTSAFSSSVEVKVTDTDESAAGFRLGIGNTVYPFDISLYIKGTNTKTEPKDGYAVTISLPVPDDLLYVKEQLSVAHKADDGTVTTLASQLKQIDGVWYLVFEATEFSPYALVLRNAGTYDEAAGLPYYVDSNGNEVFIGFAANGKYIAPSGVTVLVKENTKSFTDTGSHWAKNYIRFVTEREIFLGTGNGAFSPDSGMTRAMFATVIGRLYERSYGEIETMSAHAFTDCDYGAYYGKYVDWAAENGIITGIGGSLFVPNREITRQEMAAILYRFADFLGVLPDDMDTALSYPDADSISSYAKNAALYCQSTGIITGRDGGSFVPQGTAARAEVATIIQRFVESVLT